MSQETKQMNIMKPREDVFAAKHAIGESLLAKGVRFPVFDRVEYPPEGGIYVYYKGMPYPKKGFPYPEAVWNNDNMKRITLTFLKALAIKDMWLPVLAFAILPWKKKMNIAVNALNHYTRVGKWLLGGQFLQKNRYSIPVQMMRKLVKSFLFELGIFDRIELIDFLSVIATLIEYDDSYRYRIEDIVTEANKNKLASDPIGEIKRLGKILEERELSHAKDTFRAAIKMVTLGLRHPKIRSAFQRALNHMKVEDFEKMKLDNADRYHVLLRGDYNFLGLTFEQRKKIYEDFFKEKNLPYPPEVELA